MRTLIALVALSAFIDVAAAHAQLPAETRVSERSSLIIDTIDGRSIATLARAANVPMGLVRTTSLPGKLSIRTAGRRLGDVLDQIVAADPRYEWRDVDGVVVIRASHVWSEFLLPRPVSGLALIDADASSTCVQRIRSSNDCGRSRTGPEVPAAGFSVTKATGSASPDWG